MKKLFSSILAVVVAFAIVLGTVSVPNKVKAADMPKIPFDEDLKDYIPERDGYYGLLPIIYDKEAGSTDMLIANLAVMVFNNHVYINTNDIEKITGLSVIKSGNHVRLSAYERNLVLTAGSSEAYYYLGSYTDAYCSLKANLSAPSYNIDGEMWVPFRDVCIMLDVPFYDAFSQGYGTSFIIVNHATENLYDVFAYLNEEADDLAARYTNNIVPTYASSELVELTSKLIDGDLRVWGAALMAAVGADKKGYKIVLGQLAEDITKELMIVSPDEAKMTEVVSHDKIVDYVKAFNQVVNGGAHAVLSLFSEKGMQFMSKLSKNTSWLDLASVQKKYSTLKDLSGKFNKVAGVSEKFLQPVLSMADNLINYYNVDKISANGVDVINANREYLTFSDPTVLDRIGSYSKKFGGGAMGYSVGEYLGNHLGDYVLDGLEGLAGGIPAFTLLQLATHLLPGLSTSISDAHSFNVSMLYMPLQSDAQNILKAALDSFNLRNASEEDIRYIMDAAYMYLKICYLARNHAVTASDLSGSDLGNQIGLMNKTLRYMVSISSEYETIPENIYAKYYRATGAGDDSDIIDFLSKQYLKVSGEVLEKDTEKAIPDAKCAVLNAEGNECGYFEGTPGGEYNDVFVPTGIYKSGGIKEFTDNNSVVAKLRFTSPTFKGEDIVTAEGEPGSEVDPVDTAYLGAAGPCIKASQVQPLNGMLFAVSTTHVTSNLVKQIQLPTDSGFGVVTFAGYKDKVFFVEKTGGSDGYDVKLVGADMDGSDRFVIAEENETMGISFYFTIENGWVIWQEADTYNSGNGGYKLRGYDIETGKYIEEDRIRANCPISMHVVGNSRATIKYVDDDTYKLYKTEIRGDGLIDEYLLLRKENFAEEEYEGTMPYADGAKGIFCVLDDKIVYSRLNMENASGELWYMDIYTGETEKLGEHPSVGGGDVFFNY